MGDSASQVVDGVRIEKAVSDDRADHPVVAVRVTNERSEPVRVRFVESMPGGVERGDVRVAAEGGSDYWTWTARGLQFGGRLDPDETVTSAYLVEAPPDVVRENLATPTATVEPVRSAGGGRDSATRERRARSGNAASASGGGRGGDSEGDTRLPRPGRRAAIVLVLVLAVAAGSSLVVSADADTLSLYDELAGPTDPFDGDTDGDRLADGLDAGQADPTDPDTDGDGLSDGEEWAFGSSPREADTDGDGLRDPGERATGADPQEKDTDDDGVGDAREARAGSNPRLQDSDGDGLPDPAELRQGTDPAAADTDGDGLPDRFESRHARGAPTNPDTDGDGLQDGREYALGTYLHRADSDRDGLLDPREVELGTDPKRVDTDGDGAWDSVELQRSTDPLVVDTDADDLPRKRELAVGTDPTNPDTDGDNLPDGLEATDLAGADPLHVDVYVEIDYVGDSRLSGDERRALVEAFATAPVENPDGAIGIALHLVRSERVPRDDPFEGSDLSAYYRKYADYACRGYYYAVLSPTVALEGRVVAGFSGGVTLASASTASVFMHELGHSLGLVHMTGVDSRAVPFSEYPSVMNYNAPAGYVGFSTGGHGPRDHDDWAIIAREPGSPAVPLAGTTGPQESCEHLGDTRGVGTP